MTKYFAIYTHQTQVRTTIQINIIIIMNTLDCVVAARKIFENTCHSSQSQVDNYQFLYL